MTVDEQVLLVCPPEHHLLNLKQLRSRATAGGVPEGPDSVIRVTESDFPVLGSARENGAEVLANDGGLFEVADSRQGDSVQRLRALMEFVQLTG